MHGKDSPRASADARPAPRARGADENLYIVAYDIGDPRRWRRVFRLMNGYGEWVQLSVFQCRLSRRRRIELKLALGEIIDHAQDHVVILDLGPAAGIRPRVDSLGKPFTVVERGPVIV
jgi:CRISPR-associated protein Cas2